MMSKFLFLIISGMGLWLPALVAGNISSSNECPMNLTYVKQMPWDASACEDRTEDCCQALLSVLGIGIAQYLREESMFELPNYGSAAACIEAYQTEIRLRSPGIPIYIIHGCFSDIRGFVSSPNLCAGIRTKQDWIRKIGNNTEIDKDCGGDLSDLNACRSCKESGDLLHRSVIDLYGSSPPSIETSKTCYYFVVLYAAGVANRLGPLTRSTAECILRVPFKNPKNRRGRVVHGLLGVLAGVLGLGMVAMAWYLWWKITQRRRNDKAEAKRMRSLMKPNTGAMRFGIDELRSATKSFKSENIIGAGGFGTVYRGEMPDGSLIAVKEIRNCSVEGDVEFLNEVEVINSIRHKNLVVLRGWSAAGFDEDEDIGARRFLVYDFMPNGSLEDHVFGTSKPPMTWSQRQNVLLGVAKGLCYLHDGVVPAIYHRDIKPTNILLDEDMNACIADFGLARITNAGESHLTTRVAGTHGYLAPEYALYGQLTDRSDVYSFGVLVLEVMSGRRALDCTAQCASELLITDWAWRRIKDGYGADSIVDRRLREEESDGSVGAAKNANMERFVKVGILCSHVMVAFRPRMCDALKMLLGECDIPDIPDRPLPFGCSASLAETPDASSAGSWISLPEDATASFLASSTA